MEARSFSHGTPRQDAVSFPLFYFSKAQIHTVKILVLVLSLLSFLQSFILEASPIRLLVQPPGKRILSKNLTSRPVCVDQVLSLYLYDWFEQAPEVQLFDELQSASAFAEVLSPAKIARPSDLFPELNALLGIDALVRWEWQGGKLTIRLLRASGVVQRELPWSDETSTPTVLKTVTEWLATGMKLDAKSSPIQRGLPLDNGAFLESYYLAPRLQGELMENSGITQLNQLRPFITRAGSDAWVAGALMRAGATLSTDNRAIQKPVSYIVMLQQALPEALSHESALQARRFCSLNKHLPEVVEKDLLAFILQAGNDDLDDALLGNPASGKENPRNGGAAIKTRQAGALRCLGAMKSKAALGHFLRTAKAADPVLRRATAWALAQYPADINVPALDFLKNDPDPETAFYAAWALSTRGQKDSALAYRAAACLSANSRCEDALMVLSSEGTQENALQLRSFMSDVTGLRRALAFKGLLKLGALKPEDIQRGLADPDGAVIRSALGNLPPSAFADCRQALLALSGHPDSSIAEAARIVVHSLAPTETRALRLFELDVEHHYVRRQIVQALASENSQEALADLEAATKNKDPHIRALALRHLGRLDPDRARKHLPALLEDGHRLVRLQAAAVASQVATAAVRGPVEKALASNPEDAAALYLGEAIARSKGERPPMPRPSVNRVSAEKAMSFNCGMPSDPQTPFEGFYLLTVPGRQSTDAPQWEVLRKAQSDGRVILPRANKTAKNPAQVLLNSSWKDAFWLGLDAEFEGHWESLDGLVLGEESMYFRPFNEWDNGWRLFCREAGIDPKVINGAKERLSQAQKDAWWDWEQRIAVEGFNSIVDYIRLRYGKLRPGFQVATFMPDQNGPCAYDNLWDFDIAAGYEYGAPSRSRYAAIRRLKTTWPERPVLWLNQGKVGVGLGLNQTQIQHNTPVPLSPELTQKAVTSADSLCNWLAGGHPGLFAIYLFVHVGWKGEDFGRWVQLEDLHLGNKSFEEALEHSFRGLGKRYQLLEETKGAKLDSVLNKEDKISSDLLELDAAPKKTDPYAAREAAEKKTMRNGFLLERKLIQDGVNLLSGVPFPAHSHKVLFVGTDMRSPGFDLAADFDCIAKINQLSEKSLSGYQMIGLNGQAAAPLREQTISALVDWLRNQPSLLYVNGWVSTDNQNLAATATNWQSSLQTSWPWKEDLTPVRSKRKVGNREVDVIEGYDCKAPQAIILERTAGVPSLVFWQGSGIKGGVLFDAGKLTAAQLQPVFNRLVEEKKIGLVLSGPIGMAGIKTTQFSAYVSCSAAAAPFKVQGKDFLSGALNPELKPERSGVLAADSLRGKFAVCENGVSVLGKAPIEQVVPIPGGLRIKGGGLTRIGSNSGRVQVVAEGMSLPVIKKESMLDWMFDSQEPGILEIERDPSYQPTTLVRANGWITVTDGAPSK